MPEDPTAKGLFTQFVTDVSGIDVPAQFTFPFAYTPHPLSVIAARELQAYLQSQTEWAYEFGRNSADTFGKMFGVLVVESAGRTIGYLSAFSGKLAGSTRLSRFVPPVYDMLQDQGFYRAAEAEVEAITAQIHTLTNSPEFQHHENLLANSKAQAEKEISELKDSVTQAKIARHQQRDRAVAELSPAELATLTHQLDEQSTEWSYRLKDLRRHWRRQLGEKQIAFAEHQSAFDELVTQRKSLSAHIQQRLFREYQFLNAQGITKNLFELFPSEAGDLPPSGAGECAAPKLLHYAFRYGLRPLCLAEFWWGASPASEVRHHGNFYPACRSKCEPILGHMLAGIPMEPNPVKARFTRRPGAALNVIFEDDHLAIVDKPSNLLSNPGKEVSDSVFSRALAQFPEATGPILVHRLDMSTSGLMVIAKSKHTYAHIQNQFTRRTIAKQYVALLDGVPAIVEEGLTDGSIDLPLRVDLDARPRQLVCRQFGKPALTRWRVIAVEGHLTRIRFFPVTGRTHQLRVHAAHNDGLGVPIVGDDLYGTPAHRLCLHADQLQLIHPITEESILFRSDPSF